MMLACCTLWAGLQLPLEELIAQATADDEHPAAPSVIDTLKEQAQLCAAPEEAARIACLLREQLEAHSMAVRLKTLQLVTLMLHEQCAPALHQAVRAECTDAVQSCLGCAEPHPTRGDRPASLVRGLGAKAAKLLERTLLNRSRTSEPNLSSLSVAAANASAEQSSGGGGGAVRIIVDGAVTPAGGRVQAVRAWARRKRALLTAPPQ